ncbi:hypothetical protein U1Q18_014859 [Sarracenia purpurea var. burkii]
MGGGVVRGWGVVWFGRYAAVNCLGAMALGGWYTSSWCSLICLAVTTSLGLLPLLKDSELAVVRGRFVQLCSGVDWLVLIPIVGRHISSW